MFRKEDFRGLMEEKTVGKWRWRLDKDVKGSRTWRMRLRSNWIWFKDGGSNDAQEYRN